MRLTSHRRSAKPLTALLITCLLFGGCADSYEDQRDRLLKAAARQQIGSSPDWLLVKYGMSGDDPIALIYGMSDDLAFCLELAELHKQRYPGDTYGCHPAQ